MPDYNPDREGHRNHKWIVHKAMRTPGFTSVKADDREMRFNREGRFSVKDETVAAEIRKKYPREATVTRVTDWHPSDRGHNYFFSVPELPWKRGRDGEEEKENEETSGVQSGPIEDSEEAGN